MSASRAAIALLLLTAVAPLLSGEEQSGDAAADPLFEEKMTWFNMATDESNWVAIARILDALADAGFNGVRLPMFPEDSRVTGIDP